MTYRSDPPVSLTKPKPFQSSQNKTLDSRNKPTEGLKQHHLSALSSISTTVPRASWKGAQDEAGSLRDLSTLAACLTTGRFDDERFAVTSLADHRGISFFIAKKGAVTAADKDAAQKLRDVLVTSKDRDSAHHSITKDAVFDFISTRSYVELNRRLAELHSAVVDFKLDQALEMYHPGGRYGNIYKEFPDCKNYVSHRDYEFAFRNRPTVRELLLHLFSDLEQFTLPSYMTFPPPSSESSARNISNSSKRLDAKFHQLAAAARILLQSKFLAYYTSDTCIRHCTSNSQPELEMVRRQTRELMRRLENIYQYVYDLRHLVHNARRYFPAGNVNVEWVDHSAVSSSDFMNIDPELQLALHLHNSTHSPMFADPTLKLPIGCSRQTSFYAAHWLSAYNDHFPEQAKWVVRSAEEDVSAAYIAPRPEHCTIYTKTDPTASTDFVDAVSSRVLNIIDPHTQQTLIEETSKEKVTEYSKEKDTVPIETEKIEVSTIEEPPTQPPLKWYVHLSPIQEPRKLGNKFKSITKQEKEKTTRGTVWTTLWRRRR